MNRFLIVLSILVVGLVTIWVLLDSATDNGVQGNFNGNPLSADPVAATSGAEPVSRQGPDVKGTPGPNFTSSGPTYAPSQRTDAQPDEASRPATRGKSAQGTATASPINTTLVTTELRTGQSIRLMLRDRSSRIVTLKATRLVAQYKRVTLWATATVEVSGIGVAPQSAEIPAAYFRAPTILNGVRVYVDVTKEFNDDRLRDGGGTSADARLVLSDARFPLTDTTKFRWPLPTQLWQEGGNQTYWQGLQGSLDALYHHGGIDLGAPVGTPFHAWASGVVQAVDRGFDWTLGLGQTDRALPPSLDDVLHVADVSPSVIGKRVEAGQLIATTWRADWYHVHFASSFLWGPVLAEWYMAGASPVALSYIKDWLVVGPFWNEDGSARLSKDYLGDEAAVMPKPDAPAPGNTTWRVWDNAVPGVVSIGETVDPYPYSGWAWVNGNYFGSAAYLATYVYSEEPRAALLNVGSSDAVKVWLGTEQVLSADRCIRGQAGELPGAKPTIAIDEFRTSVRLDRGWNRLLVKAAQGDGCPPSWQLAVRISDESGRPIPDLRISSHPDEPAPTPTPSTAPVSQPTPRPVTLSGTTSDFRPINLQVDADRAVYPFAPTMRGVAMNTWNWLEGGIRDLTSAKRKALQDATSYLKPGVIRFAGGLWVNRTGWSRSGAAPDDGAWTYTDPVTSQTYSYTHAYKPSLIDSYAQFARDLNAQTVMQVNICDNNPAMWADLLRYTNVEHTYNFKYWELGNELDLDTCVTSAQYAQRFAAYATALKGVDPAIQLLGPVPTMPYKTAWYQDLLTQMGSGLDVLTWHWYQLTNWSSDPTTFAYEGGSVAALLEYRNNVGSVCHDGFGCYGQDTPLTRLDRMTYRRGIAEAMKQTVIAPNRQTYPQAKTAITEIGPHASAHTSPINSNHIAAIWLGDMLGRWAYNGLDILTYYSLEDGGTSGGNSRGLLGIDNNQTLDVRPIYSTAFLYAQHFGDMMVQSSSDDPEQKVVVWASTDSKDPGALKLMLVNLKGTSVVSNLQVQGFTPTVGYAYEMTSTNPLSMADPTSYTNPTTTINGVAIPDYQVASPAVFQNAVAAIQPKQITASTNFTYTLPAYSVVALTLRSSGNAAR